MRLLVPISMIAVAVSMPCAGSDIFYVSPFGSNVPPYSTWADACTNPAPAITIAQDGDTVLVANGCYSLHEEISITNGVLLQSVGAAEDTILDGRGSNRCLTISHTNAVVEGFTIRNGFTENSGAGVVIWYGGSLIDCLVVSNTAHSKGGGIRCDSFWPYEEGGHIRITSCVISGNSTSDEHGGLHCFGSNVVVESSTISDNSAAGPAGGVYCTASSVLRDCLISANSGWSGGGAVCAGSARMERCTIVGNSCTNSGGGVFLAGGTLRGCVIANNTDSEGSGGGIWGNDHSCVENCTIVSNFAGNAGGGLALLGENVRVMNSIMLLNVATTNENVYDTGASNLFSFCCSSPLPSNGTGNINATPLFVDPSGGDYHLRATSPCIDAGTNLAWVSFSADIDGQPRRFGDAVDIGADEAVLRARSITLDGVLTTTWDCVVDSQCQLQRSLDLASGPWDPVGSPVTCTQSTLVAVHTNMSVQATFYRLMWLNP